MNVTYLHTLDKILDTLYNDIKDKVEQHKKLSDIRKHLAEEWYTMYKLRKDK